MRGFKRSVIKEELLKLTGDYKLAIVTVELTYEKECNSFVNREETKGTLEQMAYGH